MAYPALLRYIISLQVVGKVKKYSSDFALDYLLGNSKGRFLHVVEDTFFL